MTREYFFLGRALLFIFVGYCPTSRQWDIISLLHYEIGMRANTASRSFKSLNTGDFLEKKMHNIGTFIAFHNIKNIRRGEKRRLDKIYSWDWLIFSSKPNRSIFEGGRN